MKRRRLLRWGAASLVAAGVLLFAAWQVVLRSQWLREKIRLRAIAEIERATGGKASIEKFDFDPNLLRVEVFNLTLRGTEPQSAPPLFQAARVQAGLKIISFFKTQVDLQSIDVESPKLHFLVDENGRNNLPSPARRASRERTVMEDVLRLAADRFRIAGGEFIYQAKRTPFEVAGRNMKADFAFDAAGPVYRGAVDSDDLEIQVGRMPRLAFHLSAKAVIEKDGIDFFDTSLNSGLTRIAAKGRIQNFGALHGAFDVDMHSNVSESVRLFGFSAGKGAVSSQGKVTWGGADDFTYSGDLHGAALDLAIGEYRVQPVAVSGHLAATRAGLRVTKLRAKAPEGEFAGEAELPAYRGYAATGVISGLTLRSLRARTGGPGLAYGGSLSGPVRVEGTFDNRFAGEINLELQPSEGDIPLRGQIAAKFDSATGAIALHDSYVAANQTRADFNGTLNQTMRVKFATSRLEDVQPALEMAGQAQPLPVRLDNGSIQFEGTASGDWRDPLLAGQLRASNVIYENIPIASAGGTVVVSPSKLTLTSFSMKQGEASVTGTGSIALGNWKAGAQSAVDLRLEARNVLMSGIRAQAGIAAPLEGVVNATADIQGTFASPRGQATFDWYRPGYGDERLDRISATLRLRNDAVDIVSFEGALGRSSLSATGAYTRSSPDWRNGEADLAYQLSGLDLSSLQSLRQVRRDVDARVTSSGKAVVKLVNGAPELSVLDAQARLANIAVAGKPLGNLNLAARTASGTLNVDVAGDFRGAPVKGNSNWRIQPGYPGTAHLEVAEVPLSVLEELRPNRPPGPAPFVGALRGTLDFRGPATDIDKWHVDLNIPSIYFRSAPRSNLAATPAAAEFEFRNNGPIQLSADGRTITVRAANFVAKDTNISASGTFSLAGRRPWDLRVNGSVNLAGLRSFTPDLAATGVATMQATVRGELASPQVFGTLGLKDATLSLEGLPNGLDKVTGRVLFDRSRATIEDKLTAESGGGSLALSGFVDFSNLAEIFYRLEADANDVRIRYPEGVSTVADANITLSGSTERSLMAGVITVVRSGFTPRTDLGSLLAESSRSDSIMAESNRFLANMQLDIKVRTSPETQFTTSLTKDLQAEANLQVRGTGAHPVALGRVTISQGDINFFGNKYTIKRGDVSFYNPTKNEPTLDLDLETRARGVDVTVNFSGPIDKLNVSYRSDPPLQPSEIIALLTAGRTPTSSTIGSSQSYARGSFLESGATSLLGSAISAPISSQLQRFFGVSRIKIDPTIFGLEGTPQARVTVEQQVSKDVTITYISNLSRTQQQVVRFEWSLSREWSMIVQRDENGSFGMDFQLRKQVK